MTHDEEPIDIETYLNEGRAIPAGRRYRIRVDNTRFIVSSPITGQEVLSLVGKSPSEWDVILKLRPQGQRPVGAEEPVDLTAPGVERFVTMKRQVTDGEETPPPRRQAKLRKQDIDFLDTLTPRWEALKEGDAVRILIPGLQLPSGLVPVSETEVWVSFRLEGAYPDTQIDMACFYPHLRRRDGKPIPNISGVTIDGRDWQQWSRHRGDASSWRPDVDGIDTHYEFMRSWLEREVAR